LLQFQDGETIDDFGIRSNCLIMQLAVLGNTYNKVKIVRCFLQALPPRLDQIITSIETLLDLANVSIDELIGRLK
jgi:hypothetical protein